MNKNETECEVCRRKSSYLIPKLSKKKGYEGWKMVCRICYDRLTEAEEEIDNRIISKKEMDV